MPLVFLLLFGALPWHEHHSRVSLVQHLLWTELLHKSSPLQHLTFCDLKLISTRSEQLGSKLHLPGMRGILPWRLWSSVTGPRFRKRVASGHRLLQRSNQRKHIMALSRTRNTWNENSSRSTQKAMKIFYLVLTWPNEYDGVSYCVILYSQINADRTHRTNKAIGLTLPLRT